MNAPLSRASAHACQVVLAAAKNSRGTGRDIYLARASRPTNRNNGLHWMLFSKTGRKEVVNPAHRGGPQRRRPYVKKAILSR